MRYHFVFFFFLNQAKTAKTNFLQSLNIKGKLPTSGALLIKKKLKVRIIKMGGGGKGVSCKAWGPDFEFQDPHSGRKKTGSRVVLTSMYAPWCRNTRK